MTVLSAERPASRTNRRAARVHGRAWLPYALIAPAALYLVLLQGVPLLRELQLSFTRTSLLQPNELTFVGLDNYRSLVTDPAFARTIVVTGVYVVVCVVGTVGVGLGAALLLNQRLPFKGVIRSIVIIPWAVPPVALALTASWMMNPDYGFINRTLGLIGAGDLTRVWLNDPNTALPAILVTTIWQLSPFTSLVILAALQSVSRDLVEAAQVDGAGALSRFGAVIWPTILPTVALLTVLMTIWSLRRFELIWLMTQGGPTGATNTLVIDVYRRAFQFNDLGSGAAVGMVGVVVAMVVTIAYFILTGRAERRNERA